VPAPEVLYDCSETKYTVRYLLAGPGEDCNYPPYSGQYIQDNVFGDHTQGFRISGLPLGCTWIEYEVTDECHNSSVCQTEVYVRDAEPPTAVCVEFSTVSIGADGTAKVFAESFDNGSWDNCGIALILARKMTNRCAGENTTQFKEQLLFCCEEVGSQIMVEMKVIDVHENENTCMVEIRVDDKLPPFITRCPANITLDCWEDYEDLDLTGRPDYVDNCAVVDVSYSDVVNLDNCGFGNIRRTWTVRDAQDFTHSCSQTISMVNSTPFGPSQIIWPRDYTATTCNSDLRPENLPLLNGFPRLTDNVCALTSFTYEDQVFTFVEGSCVKILRRWSVIDWCTYKEDGSAGIWHHLQVVKLVNNKGPEIVCEDAEVCSFGECGGQIEFTLNAADDCTPDDQLKFSWTILRGTTQVASGSGRTISRTLADGEYIVNWVVEDKCLNKTHCTHKLTVKDCKKPTPYCISLVTSVIMPSSGMLEIWASDFDYGSFDNCTRQENLIFSFSANVNNTSHTFTCDDIPDGVEMYLPVQIWVTDEAGNQDFCTVAIILQDSMDDVCDDITGNLVYISGRIATEDAQPLSGATVNLYKDGNMMKQSVSQNTGMYNINQVLMGYDYAIDAVRNGELLNGVSTLDIVLMQRHILQMQLLESPFKVIAADVNNDGNVSVADLVALRRVILGQEIKFPNNQRSWRLVDKSQTFVNAQRPFPFQEKIHMQNLSNNMIQQDFVAVKIGDVNNSTIADFDNGYQLEARNDQSMVVEIPVEKMNRTETIELPVFAGNFDLILGMQFTLALDITAVDFKGIKAAALSVSEQNISRHRQDEGLITFSWNAEDALEVNYDEALFFIVIEAKQEANSNEVLQIVSEITAAEAYNENFEAIKLSLGSRSDSTIESGETFMLFQNTPNPFRDFTTVGYSVPEDGNVRFSVFDLTGRKLKEINTFAFKGYNTIQLRKDELQSNGVLIYQAEFGQYQMTKKMILIE
jgi:hypothetical protein